MDHSESEPLGVLRSAADLIERESLFQGGELVLLAISGGQDSRCLLDAMVRLAPKFELRLHVAHIDHQLRGRVSAQDAQFVAAIAQGYGLPCTILSVDVAAYRGAHRLGTQVAARSARYQLLAALARQLDTVAVAVGHTRDDLVETFLLNLLRGSGIEGLVAIQPCQELRLELLGPPLGAALAALPPAPPGYTLRIARPLLAIKRRETAAYCEARGLEYRVDASNALNVYRRNRIRAELLPVLERFNPRVRRSLADTVELLRQDLTLVAAAVHEAWARVASTGASDVQFDRETFLSYPAAVQRHLLRRAVATLAGTSAGLHKAAVDSALRVIGAGKPGRVVNLPSGLELSTSYDCVTLRPVPRRGLADGYSRVAPVELSVPGRAALGEIGAAEVELLTDSVKFKRASVRPLETSRYEVWLDAEKLGTPLVLRTRRPGDRMQPLGLRGMKKLQDILVDAKVPRERRDLIPLVESPRGIAWLVGLRVDDRFRLDESTRHIAVLRFRPGPALEWHSQLEHMAGE